MTYLRQNRFANSTNFEDANYTQQYINRILNYLVTSGKLKFVGEIGRRRYYALARSRVTIDEIKQELDTSADIMPLLWHHGLHTPTQFLKLIESMKKSNSSSLFDSEHPRHIDWHNEVVPAIEAMVYGNRAHTRAELDEFRSTVSTFAERVQSLHKFLEMFLENQHVKSGAVEDALSDYSVNRYRSGYYQRDEEIAE